jgi:hypothetical protein
MTQKSLEQQLADAHARQERIKARLAQLEVRKKAKDERKRTQGTMSLIKAVLDRAAAEAAFKEEIRALVATASLRPPEREAALSLLASLDAANSAMASPVPAEQTGWMPPPLANRPPKCWDDRGGAQRTDTEDPLDF